MKYINAKKLKSLIEAEYKKYVEISKQTNASLQCQYIADGLEIAEGIIDDAIQQDGPEPYFYCKYGGTMPLCSTCKRNHKNSSFKTEEITTWYAPSNGTKHCIDYIKQEQPDMDLELEKELDSYYGVYRKDGKTYDIDDDEECVDWKECVNPYAEIDLARHFYELGLKSARKED